MKMNYEIQYLASTLHCAYESKKLKDHGLNYSTHGIDSLTIVHTLRVWRQYLAGPTFEPQTDHQILWYILPRWM